MASRWLCRWLPWACARRGGAASGGTILPPVDDRLIEWVRERVEEINARGELPPMEEVSRFVAELRARSLEDEAALLAVHMHELAEMHNTQHSARTYAEQSALLAALGRGEEAAAFAGLAETTFLHLAKLQEAGEEEAAGGEEMTEEGEPPTYGFGI